MRGKLSHPDRPPTGSPGVHEENDRPVERGMRARAASLSLSLAFPLALALAFAMPACQAQDPENDPIAKATSEGAGPDDAPFVWPEDPSHPVLELQVTLPDSDGRILIELMPELAPATVVDVIELANEGFYDGTTFHRVIPGFMIQGGDPNSRDRDPTNDGTGAPGRPLHDEFGDAPFVRGVVGMGNKGRVDSTSTQFFIMHGDDTNLDGRYTAIGRVIHGLDLVDDITRVAIDRAGRWGQKDRPIENVVIASVRTIGQVAAVRADLEGSTGNGSDDGVRDRKGQQLAANEPPSTEPPRSPRSSSPPAASANDDWEALEAMGR